MDTGLEKKLSSAKKARLIPTLPDSKKRRKCNVGKGIKSSYIYYMKATGGRSGA